MMKKSLKLVAVILIVSAFCMIGASTAAIETTTSNLGSSDLTVKYNGEEIVFPDAQPFIDENSRTLIPVRFVAETMGADVTWDQETQAAVIEQDGIIILVPIGSDTISVIRDGSASAVTMDTAAIVIDERTYVPIRFVAEALGAWVSYSDLFTTVQIYKDSLSTTDITRLHSYYDMTWGEYIASTDGESYGITDESWLTSNPQIAYFIGTFGFENANEWKLRNPNGIEVLTQPARKPTNYVGVISGLTYTYGTQPDLDFANLVLAEAHGVEDEINSAGKVTISLKTDLACVYASRHANTAATYVRGVLSVTIPENADIDWIKENYDFISDPRAGETRDIDVEIRVNTFTANVHWSSMIALG